jgi:hypothetical protein
MEPEHRNQQGMVQVETEGLRFGSCRAGSGEGVATGFSDLTSESAQAHCLLHRSDCLTVLNPIRL